jgi:hypothetical protein
MDEATGAGMAGRIIARDGRASQDELSLGPSIVHGVANVVPELGLNLPFVDESGGLSLEQEARISRERLSGSDRVDADLAASGAASGLGLADRLRSLDHDCPDGVERARELVVEDPRAVVHGEECLCRKRRRQSPTRVSQRF